MTTRGVDDVTRRIWREGDLPPGPEVTAVVDRASDEWTRDAANPDMWAWARGPQLVVGWAALTRYWGPVADATRRGASAPGRRLRPAVLATVGIVAIYVGLVLACIGMLPSWMRP